MQHTSDYGKNVDEMNIIFDVITAYMIFQMTRNGDHFAITINMAKILVLLNLHQSVKIKKRTLMVFVFGLCSVNISRHHLE